MMIANNAAYTPADPMPGKSLLHIVSVQKKIDACFIYYDFAVGPSVGWASEKYISTGTWLLWQRIDAKTGARPLSYLLSAVRSNTSYALISDIKQAVGCCICANIDVSTYKGRQVPHITHTYPASSYTIRPDDIRIGTTSWAAGSADTIRADYLANHAGLPVLQVDVREKGSPMVDWCAAHNIALLPMTFPAGDYSLPGKKVIVDRKDSIIELYHNFGHSSNRASYEHAANIAAAQGCRLVYVIATDEAEQINCIEDVSRWSALLHNGTKINGKNLREILEKYTFIHSNADFLFVPRTQQCGAIWNVLQQPR